MTALFHRERLHPAKFKIHSKRVFLWEDCRQECLGRLYAASKYDIPPLVNLPAHNGKAVIVGSGPSLSLSINQIRDHVGKSMVWTLNAAHQYLVSRGITPNAHVLFEDDVFLVEESLGGTPCKDTTYYICSHCHPNLFDQLGNYRKILWHANFEPQDYQDTIARLFPGQFMVGVGFVTFFRTLSICIILGFRDFEFYGIDCSFEPGGSDHVEGYAIADKEDKLNIYWEDGKTKELRSFRSNGSLSFMAHEFLEFCAQYHHDLKIKIHGNSLLRHIHMSRYPKQYS
jgi:Protein of unknown function DUF115